MKFPVAALLTFFVLGCHNNENDPEDNALKNKLPTTLVNNPRTMNDGSEKELNALGRLVFDDTLHNFGTMHEGEVVEYEFNFTNGGKKDIIIDEAKASCGCTVPEFPSGVLKPGDKDKIKVTFNSEGKKGVNEKSVFVTTNGNPAIYTLLIQATVLDK